MITPALALLSVAILMWPPQSAAALRLADLAARGRLPARAAPARAAAGHGPVLRFRSARLGRRRRTAQDADVLRAVRLVAQELRSGADPARAWAGAAAVARGESEWIALVARQAAAGEPIGSALAEAAQHSS
ncbi:MAG: hypothetical protein JWN61_2423, partial [Pseudonocardiales bacterium]|nr:hypothetical protein [Pseudonocardiales bacterium]